MTADTHLASPVVPGPVLQPALAGPDRRDLYRIARSIGVVAVTALLVATLALPSAVARAALAIAVAGALLGLPHGAVDHVVPGWLARRPLPLGPLAALLGGYVAVVAVGAVALRLAPT